MTSGGNEKVPEEEGRRDARKEGIKRKKKRCPLQGVSSCHADLLILECETSDQGRSPRKKSRSTSGAAIADAVLTRGGLSAAAWVASPSTPTRPPLWTA